MGKTELPPTQAEELRALIREAREATRDLRACMREFEHLIVEKADDAFNKNTQAVFIQLGRSVDRSFQVIESNARNAFADGIDRCIECIEKAATALEGAGPHLIAKNFPTIRQAFMSDAFGMLDRVDSVMEWHQKAGMFLAKGDPGMPPRQYKR